MIDKNLLSFLQFRDEVIDTRPLEEKFGITLPPIYRAFISTFKPFFAHHQVMNKNGELETFLVEFYSSEKLREFTIDDDELSFESFKELEDVLTFERSNKGYLADLLFIANHGYSGGLLVGIGNHNQDQIFHNTDSKVITPVANNVLELIHGMQYVQHQFDSPQLDTSSLYNNWGENFWRLKE